MFIPEVAMPCNRKTVTKFDNPDGFQYGDYVVIKPTNPFKIKALGIYVIDQLDNIDCSARLIRVDIDRMSDHGMPWWYPLEKLLLVYRIK